MDVKQAYDQLCREYIDSCKACDECVAEWWCIENQLRTGRAPQSNCPDKLKEYYRQKSGKKESKQ